MVTVFIIGLLSGYLLYHLFRNYIASLHRLLFGLFNTIIIGALILGTLYFVVLYKDYPGYYGISIDLLSVVVGFVVGFCIDKLSDYVVSRKIRRSMR